MYVLQGDQQDYQQASPSVDGKDREGLQMVTVAWGHRNTHNHILQVLQQRLLRQHQQKFDLRWEYDLHREFQRFKQIKRN